MHKRAAALESNLLLYTIMRVRTRQRIGGVSQEADCWVDFKILGKGRELSFVRTRILVSTTRKAEAIAKLAYHGVVIDIHFSVRDCTTYDYDDTDPSFSEDPLSFS